ncbi:MoxR-like ATPase [Halogranum rubrum]|uniref:MoxR-like ATPase n=1 Tax=Halogranum rubrum TaxID=553466 RepID=A0A1I4BAR2_9EURY|nr:MoxR family ATPase [Halogranum rubrum]SFK65071.1 MoxR-like ATPase [Halogranum rubrum]
MSSPQEVFEAIRAEAGTVLIGNEDIIEGLTISMLTGGHTLLEGVPGVAKTTIATLFARSTGLQYQRIQMTPDVLPADITGTHIYRENLGEFELQRGPVFANLVLADEINRATPKTQSALLEAMQEGNVTIEGDTLELPKPFMVVATQNPIEQEGTFELPEAQRDRFQLKYVVDLPQRAEEKEMLKRFDSSPALGPNSIERVVTAGDLLAAREVVNEIYVDEKVHEYILDLVAATRESEAVEHGASPRASLAFLNAGKARAAIRGRDFVTPDDVKALAPNVLIHRLILGTEAELSGRSRKEIVNEILGSVSIPQQDLDADEATVG